jgi:hypothetical protein
VFQIKAALSAAKPSCSFAFTSFPHPFSHTEPFGDWLRCQISIFHCGRGKVGNNDGGHLPHFLCFFLCQWPTHSITEAEREPWLINFTLVSRRQTTIWDDMWATALQWVSLN